MSQTYNLPTSSNNYNTAILTNINQALESLRSDFSGANFPTNPTPVAGQVCYKNGVAYRYDGTNWMPEQVAWTMVSKYASLAAAVTAIGATPITLVIDSAINASNTAEAVTVPSTLALMPISPGIISKNTATSLTINGSIVGNPMHQWLSGFTLNTNLTISSTYNQIFYNTWLGILNHKFILGPATGNGPFDPESVNDMDYNGFLLRNDEGGNVATVQQTNPDAFSAIRAVDNLGYEHTAWGYGNGTPGSSEFARNAFWEHFNPNSAHSKTAPFQSAKIVSTIHGGYQSTNILGGGPHTNYGYVRILFAEDGTMIFRSLEKALTTYGDGGTPVFKIGDTIAVGGPMKFHNNSTFADGVITGNSPILPIMTGYMLFTSEGISYPLLTLKTAGLADTVSHEVLKLKTGDASGDFNIDVSLVGSTTLVDRRARIQTHNSGSGDSGIISLQPTGGGVSIGAANTKSKLGVTGLVIYANNAAAVAAGLLVGDFYRTGADPDTVCVVH